MKLQLRVCKLLFVALLAATGAAQAATVYDNSFEDPGFTDGGWGYYSGSAFNWTFDSAGIASQNSPWFMAAPPDGSDAGFIQDGGSILQDITDFNPADLYVLTFYVVQRVGYGLNPIQATLTDDSDSSVIHLGTATPSGDSSFALFTSLEFQPTNSAMTLSFIGLNAAGDNDTALDLVTFADLGPASSVPEPVTLPVVGGALIAMARLSKRQSPARRAAVALMASFHPWRVL